MVPSKQALKTKILPKKDNMNTSANNRVLGRALLLCAFGLFLTQNAQASELPTQTTQVEMQPVRSVQSGGNNAYRIDSDHIEVDGSDAFAVQWKASRSVNNLRTFLLLTKPNGDVVKKEVELEGHSGAKNGKASKQHVSELLFVNKRYTHAAIRFRYTSSKQRISQVRFTAMDTTPSAERGAAANTSASLLQPLPDTASTNGKLPKKNLKGTNLKVVPRSYWLSSKKKIRKSSWNPQYKKPKRIIVHHTAGKQVNGPQYVRGVWNYHTNVLDWGDVGYNFIIGPGGAIYKGRAGVFKKYKTPVAAHTYNEAQEINFNRGSIGIALVGCFAPECDNQHKVKKKQRKALNRLLKTLSRKYHIDPYGDNTYKEYTGPNLGGHKDYDATLCPGKRAQRRVARFRDALTAWYPYADEEREDGIGITAAGKENDDTSECCCASCS
jgi:hypothetical protein